MMTPRFPRPPLIYWASPKSGTSSGRKALPSLRSSGCSLVFVNAGVEHLMSPQMLGRGRPANERARLPRGAVSCDDLLLRARILRLIRSSPSTDPHRNAEGQRRQQLDAIG